MADNNIVAHIPAGEISLPTASWESFGDVLLYMEKNPDVAKKVQKIVETRDPDAIKIVDVGETMNNLITVSSTIKLAVAASHGYPCNPIVIKMLSRFQTLVKDSALTINAFLNTSVKAVRLHQFALQLLAEGHAQDAIAILDGIIEMSDTMTAKADKLVEKSTALRDLGEEASCRATLDRSKTVEESKKAEASIAELRVKKKGLEERKAILKKDLKDAEEREKEAMKEASTERHQNFVVGIFSAIFGGPRNTSTTSTPVSQDSAPEIEAKKAKLKGEEAKLLNVQDDAEKTNIKKHITDLKNELAALRAKKPAASSLSSTQQSQATLTRARIDLQKLELEACVDLVESVARLKATRVTKNELEQAVQSLDVAVKALGQIKTTFEHTRLFWEDNRNKSAELGKDMKDLEGIKNSRILLHQQITRGGFKWMAFGQVNYTAMKAIKKADASVDNVMNNLPTTEEAWKIVEQEIPEIMKKLKSEHAQLSKAIESASAGISAD